MSAGYLIAVHSMPASGRLSVRLPGCLDKELQLRATCLQEEEDLTATWDTAIPETFYLF